VCGLQPLPIAIYATESSGNPNVFKLCVVIDFDCGRYVCSILASVVPSVGEPYSFPCRSAFSRSEIEKLFLPMQIPYNKNIMYQAQDPHNMNSNALARVLLFH